MKGLLICTLILSTSISAVCTVDPPCRPIVGFSAGHDHEATDGQPVKPSDVKLLSFAQRKQVIRKQRWLAAATARGVSPWPDLSQTEHEAAVQELKTFASKVKSKFSGVRLRETKNFLVLTSIPAYQIRPYVAQLDAMYHLMCDIYGVGEDQQIWRGKHLVIAFLNRSEFEQFELQLMQHEPSETTYGMCHQRSDGQVITACYFGKQPEDFAQMLVHETSHGFNHRMLSPQRLACWVSEGLAEWISAKLVRKSKAVKDKVEAARNRMKATGNLGGMLTAEDGLNPWQYGATADMTDFLMQKRGSYVNFIRGIKAGMTWQESLNCTYGATPEQLVTAYGQSIGVPNLRAGTNTEASRFQTPQSQYQKRR